MALSVCPIATVAPMLSILLQKLIQNVLRLSSKSEIERIKERSKVSIDMINKDNPPFFSNGPDGKLIGMPSAIYGLTEGSSDRH